MSVHLVPGVVTPIQKAPVVVEAALFDGSLDSARSIIEWARSHGGIIRLVEGEFERPDGSNELVQVTDHQLLIPTLEGEMSAKPGWVIIRGVQGEFYPCDPDILQETYVEPEVAELAAENWGNGEPDTSPAAPAPFTYIENHDHRPTWPVAVALACVVAGAVVQTVAIVLATR